LTLVRPIFLRGELALAAAPQHPVISLGREPFIGRAEDNPPKGREEWSNEPLRVAGHRGGEKKSPTKSGRKKAARECRPRGHGLFLKVRGRKRGGEYPMSETKKGGRFTAQGKGMVQEGWLLQGGGGHVDSGEKGEKKVTKEEGTRIT